VNRRTHQPAFTLIELVVAIVLVAGVAGATTFSLSQSMRALESARASREAMERAQTAVESIARQVERCVRDGDLYFARVLLTDRDGPTGPSDELLVFINDERPTRPWSNTSEACDREVQFRLAREASTGYVATDASMRVEPDELGIVEPITRGVIAMTITAFDGNRWSASWDSDRDGLPYAIEVSVIATDSKERKRVVARRTIAIDRAPLPYVKVRAEPGEDDGGTR
jgi:type II secretion system protein J